MQSIWNAGRTNITLPYAHVLSDEESPVCLRKRQGMGDWLIAFIQGDQLFEAFTFCFLSKWYVRQPAFEAILFHCNIKTKNKKCVDFERRAISDTGRGVSQTVTLLKSHARPDLRFSVDVRCEHHIKCVQSPPFFVPSHFSFWASSFSRGLL